MDEHALLVPMQIEALVLPQKENRYKFANVGKNYASLKMYPSANFVDTSPMSVLNTPLGGGVHLHWVLPEALTHGLKDSGDEQVTYPSAPNRYLVTRISVMGKNYNEINTRTWIVESDSLSKIKPLHNSCTIPDFSNLDKPYVYLGHSREFDGVITRADTHLKKLTVVSGGDTYFSAYYPNCCHVFGFYDDTLFDKTQPESNASESNPARLTYVVSGWYEGYGEENQDPLAGIFTWEECKEQFNWQVNEEVPMVQNTVCHGFVTNITWMGNYPYDTGMPPITTVPNVAVGNTSDEALAALSTYYSKSLQSERFVLNLMYENMDILTSINGDKKADKLSHGLEFTSQDSGKLTFLAVNGDKEDLNFKNNASVGEELHAIRQMQKKLQELQDNDEIFRQTVREIWEYYANEISASDDQSSIDADAVYTKLLDIRQQLQESSILQNELTASIDIDQKLLLQDVQEIGELKQEPHERFYTPNNIVVLLDGAGKNNVFENRLYSNEENGLDCRTENEIITARIINFEASSKVIFGETLIKVSEKLPKIHKALLEEAILVAKGCSEYLAQKWMKEVGKPITVSEITSLAQYLMSQIGKDQKTGGLPHALSTYIYEARWNPLLLDWKVHFYPDSELTEGKFTFKNWDLGQYDYVCKLDKPNAEKPNTYMGRTILTPNASQRMLHQGEKYLGKNEFQKIAGNDLKARGYSVLTQALYGFNEQMQCHIPLTQCMPLAFKGIRQDIAELCYEMTKNADTISPIQNGSFYEIRAGFVELYQFMVIDTFGRTLRFEPKASFVSEQLRKGNEAFCQYATLPPRVLQPIRLNVSWISQTSKECMGAEMDTPICGFVCPNLVESSLMIYSEMGILQGSLQVVYEGTKPELKWRNPPGEGYFSKNLPDNMTEDMKCFIQGILKAVGNKVLYYWLKLIDAYFWNINEKTDAQYIIGRPLALVRANIQLERKGLEMTAPAFSQYQNKISDFPIRLGEKKNFSDGLVGFCDLSSPFAFSRFFVCGTELEEGTCPYFVQHDSINLQINDNGRNLLLLMSPDAEVNIISGILPVKTVKLPNKQLELALKNIDATFLYAPLFMPEDIYALPCPKGGDIKWSFLELNQDLSFTQTTDLKPVEDKAFAYGKWNQLREGWLKSNSSTD